MRCEWKTKSCACTLCSLYASCFGFWVVLECWPVIGRLPEARGLWDMLACWFYLVSIFSITQPWLCDGMLYDMCVFDAYQSSGKKLRYMCMRHLTQPFLESSISYTWIIFSVAMMGLKCGFIFDDVMFWLDHF